LLLYYGLPAQHSATATTTMTTTLSYDNQNNIHFEESPVAAAAAAAGWSNLCSLYSLSGGSNIADGMKKSRSMFDLAISQKSEPLSS
jgi:hypothetical protein